MQLPITVELNAVAPHRSMRAPEIQMEQTTDQSAELMKTHAIIGMNARCVAAIFGGRATETLAFKLSGNRPVGFAGASVVDRLLAFVFGEFAH